MDPKRPVLVAGDPEWLAAKQRMVDGIPVGKGLLARIREIAEEHNVPWLLE